MRPAGFGNPMFSKIGYLKNMEFTEMQGPAKDVFNQPIPKKKKDPSFKAPIDPADDATLKKDFQHMQQKAAVIYKENFVDTIMN